MSSLQEMLRNGVIYRKKICQRCGAETMEKYIGEDNSEWESHPKFELSGFGTIVIVPYDSVINRRVLELCCNCAVELDSVLNTFENNYEQ